MRWDEPLFKRILDSKKAKDPLENFLFDLCTNLHNFYSFTNCLFAEDLKFIHPFFLALAKNK